MSEYQYVEFRAVDRPLDDKQLAFAEEQSSHAEVSRWNLNVEYNYGSFRGDVDGLLRGGFDSSDCIGLDQCRHVRVDVLDTAIHVDLWSRVLSYFFNSLGRLAVAPVSNVESTHQAKIRLKKLSMMACM